jgi:hypothetical protein
LTATSLSRSSLRFASLLSWLGDFFFFICQELVASSLLVKLKLSFPMLRLRENFWWD